METTVLTPIEPQPHLFTLHCIKLDVIKGGPCKKELKQIGQFYHKTKFIVN